MAMPQTENVMTRFSLTVLICILAVTGFLYFKGLTPSFSSDDYIHLEKNIAFKNLPELSKVFLHFDGREYRPLVRLSLWLNHHMGKTALPFHMTNLILHLACMVCLYFFYLRLMGSIPVALAGAALFALHPIHTTNVDFIMGRTGLICALFYFLSLLLFVHHATKPSARSYWISLGFFFLALLSKEEAVSLPLVLFCIVLLRPDRLECVSRLQGIRNLAPFFLMLFAYLSVRFYHLVSQAEQIAVYTNFKATHLIGNYIKWTFGFAYPFNLYKARWAMETKQFLPVAFQVFLVCLMVAALVYLLWPNKRRVLKNKVIWIGLFWFVLALAPVMGGNPHRWYLYIPSAGLCLSVAAVCRQNFQGLRRSICPALLILVTVCYAAEVYNQSNIWHRQSQISEHFLNQAEQLGLSDLEAFQFINLPFGYKSAFLFSFKSFEKALAIRSGRRPRVEILSYVNLDDNTRIRLDSDTQQVTVQMRPSAESYFIFEDLLRRLPFAGTTLNTGMCRIRITQLSRGRTAAAFEIEFLKKPAIPVFYFDGKAIRELEQI